MAKGGVSERERREARWLELRRRDAERRMAQYLDELRKPAPKKAQATLQRLGTMWIPPHPRSHRSWRPGPPHAPPTIEGIAVVSRWLSDPRGAVVHHATAALSYATLNGLPEIRAAATPGLLVALRSGQPGVQRAAIPGLLRCPPQPASQAPLEALLEARNWQTRWLAVAALTRLPTAVDLDAALLDSAPRPGSGRHAISGWLSACEALPTRSPELLVHAAAIGLDDPAFAEPVGRLLAR